MSFWYKNHDKTKTGNLFFILFEPKKKEKGLR